MMGAHYNCTTKHNEVFLSRAKVAQASTICVWHTQMTRSPPGRINMITQIPRSACMAISIRARMHARHARGVALKFEGASEKGDIGNIAK